MARYQEKPVLTDETKEKVGKVGSIVLICFLVAVIIGLITMIIYFIIEVNKEVESEDPEETVYADVYEDSEHINLEELELMLHTDLKNEKREVLTYVFVYSPNFEVYRSGDSIADGETDEVQGSVREASEAMKTSTKEGIAFYVVNTLEKDEDGYTYDSSFYSNYSISLSSGICLVVIDDGEISTFTSVEDIDSELAGLVSKLQ